MMSVRPAAPAAAHFAEGVEEAFRQILTEIYRLMSRKVRNEYY